MASFSLQKAWKVKFWENSGVDGKFTSKCQYERKICVSRIIFTKMKIVHNLGNKKHSEMSMFTKPSLDGMN